MPRLADIKSIRLEGDSYEKERVEGSTFSQMRQTVYD